MFNTTTVGFGLGGHPSRLLAWGLGAFGEIGPRLKRGVASLIIKYAHFKRR